MSLYVRVEIGFWNHRKTLRLRSLIGEAALWVPPRLWSYAASNQPDGDFSDYSDEEIAMLLDYSGNAQELLKALLSACFMDTNKHIHEWNEHNGYHSSFAERARHAAKIRWKGHEKKRKESTRKEKKGKETSIPLSIAQAPNSQKKEPTLLYPKWSREAFKKRFNDWMECRRAMGKKPGDWHKMFQEQLMWIEQYPESVALEILSASIRNNWQGLIEPKTKPGFPSKPSPSATEASYHHEPPPPVLTDEQREKNRQIVAREAEALRKQFRHE